MTISSYQVENVLRVYAKQSTSRRSVFGASDTVNRHSDTVTLTGEVREGAYDKISYSLLDILLHNKET